VGAAARGPTRRVVDGAEPDATGPRAEAGDGATFEALRGSAAARQRGSAAARLAPRCRGLSPDACEQLVTKVVRFRRRCSRPPSG
jgi:hypothetical protein